MTNEDLRLTLLLNDWEMTDTDFSTEFTDGVTVIRQEKQKWGPYGRFSVLPDIAGSKLIHLHTAEQALREVGLW